MPRILLIDDNDDGREALSTILMSTGFDVITAEEGERGLVLVRSEKPDLVIMDMNMPILDGWQAARLIRADPATAQLPIIGLSAHALRGDREKAMEAGCTDYHTKPVDFTRLAAQIEAALRAVPTIPAG